MDTICFSNPSILRCQGFTTLQSKLFIIPPALELACSTAILFANWGSSRRHLLLVAEGWACFALALTDLLSHILLPAARDSKLTVFRSLDIFLGSVSFVPILLYILFLFLFTRAELVTALPVRFQNIAKILLLLSLPTIVGLNEVASFVGVSYRYGKTTSASDPQFLEMGFHSSASQLIFTFFTSMTLALLTAYQAINFCFAFYRLVKGFVDQRRIDTTSTDDIHRFRGIGWIAAGIKLGAIESLVGFAPTSFDVAITRRIIRCLARSILMVGLVRGVDTIEDFSQIRRDLGGNKRNARTSKLRLFISNPRYSTFRQVSPSAAGFRPEDITEKQRRQNQRVTVQYDKLSAPTLHMRFSDLEIPIDVNDNRVSSGSIYPVSFVSRQETDRDRDSFVPPTPNQIYNSFSRSRSMTAVANRPSVMSGTDSIEAVRELTAQFPGLPRVSRTKSASADVSRAPVTIYDTIREDPYPSTSLSRNASVARSNSSSSARSRRKPVPSLYEAGNPFDDPKAERKRPAARPTLDMDALKSDPSPYSSYQEQTPITNFGYALSPDIPVHELDSTTLQSGMSGSMAEQANESMPPLRPPPPLLSSKFKQPNVRTPPAALVSGARPLYGNVAASKDARTVEWLTPSDFRSSVQRFSLTTPPSIAQSSPPGTPVSYMEHAQVTHALTATRGTFNIKSVGEAPRKYTPTPTTPSSSIRDSVSLRPVSEDHRVHEYSTSWMGVGSGKLVYHGSLASVDSPLRSMRDGKSYFDDED